jgi:murein lipoprotein
MMGVKKSVVAGCFVVLMAGATGCATNGDLEDLRADVEAANNTAAAAAADAASAKAAAQQASDSAQQAQDTAQEANEKVDRMFKKSMYK